MLHSWMYNYTDILNMQAKTSDSGRVYKPSIVSQQSSSGVTTNMHMASSAYASADGNSSMSIATILVYSACVAMFIATDSSATLSSSSMQTSMAIKLLVTN